MFHGAFAVHKDGKPRKGLKIPIKDYTSVLSHYLAERKAQVILLSLLMVGTTGLRLLNPQIMRSFIDAAQSEASYTLLLKRAGLFLGIALLLRAFMAVYRYVGTAVGWSATNDLRADLTEYALRLDMRFHNRHGPGELVSRLDGDVELLSHFFSSFAIELLGNLLLAVGILVVLGLEDWRMGLAFLLYALTALSIFSRMRNLAIPARKRYQEVMAQHSGFIEESLSSLEDIRAAGAKPFAVHRFLEIIRLLYNTGLRSNLIAQVATGAGNIILVAAIAGACAVGAILFLGGSVTIGTVYLILHYATMLVIPLQRISVELQTLQSSGAAISRTQELLSITSSLNDGVITQLPEAPPSIVFDRVSFGYSSEEKVLRELDFEIRSGRVLGLLGRTGSGKTTISRLLFRLYDPQEGRILYSGVDMHSLKLSVLRAQVGLVTQNVQLFRGTVRDNITLFDPEIADSRIMRIIEELGLGPWLGSLEEGLDTVVGASGRGLSSGEEQLLAFARVFLKNPKLLVLDEASSRLDPVTEAYIEVAVNRLLAGRSAVVIAHRLSTVRRVDDLLIIDAGKVVEQGERAVLEADPGSHFNYLLKTGLEEVLV